MNYKKRFVIINGIAYRVVEQYPKKCKVEICTNTFAFFPLSKIERLATKEEKKDWEISKSGLNGL